MNKASLRLLEEVKAAHKPDGSGTIFSTENAMKELITAGLVEGNPAIKNSAGDIAFRATATAMGGTAPTGDTPKPVTFTFKAVDVSQAPVTGRVGRTTTDPKQLAISGVPAGQSFFIPADDKITSKSVATLVSGANKKFAKDTDLRRFYSRQISDGALWDQAGVKGFAVFRMSDEDAKIDKARVDGLPPRAPRKPRAVPAAPAPVMGADGVATVPTTAPLPPTV